MHADRLAREVFPLRIEADTLQLDRTVNHIGTDRSFGTDEVNTALGDTRVAVHVKTGPHPGLRIRG
ncbi:MAG: hypothetical protein U5O39_06230 [Gammaproteobacteria bacterium]|nr:hypothetical protein [Gammaproteobacteria bacterium]